MKSPESPESVARTLARWQVSPPRDPNFRPAVWQRIRLPQRGAETWGSYLRGHLAGWAVATGLTVAIAGWTGHAMARSRLEANRERMVVSYLSELDPRVLTKAQPQR